MSFPSYELKGTPREPRCKCGDPLAFVCKSQGGKEVYACFDCSRVVYVTFPMAHEIRGPKGVGYEPQQQA